MKQLQQQQKNQNLSSPFSSNQNNNLESRNLAAEVRTPVGKRGHFAQANELQITGLGVLAPKLASTLLNHDLDLKSKYVEDSVMSK